MASPTSTFVRLLALVAATCQASTEADLAPSLPEDPKAVMGFFAETALDETMWDAFAEGILAFIVLGGASLSVKMYRKQTGKILKPKKKTVSSLYVAPSRATTDRDAGARANMSSGRAAVQRHLTVAPSQQKPAKVCETDAIANEAHAVASAVRAGKTAELPQLLDVALRRSLVAGARPGTPSSEEEVASQLLFIVLRVCAGSRCFNEALVAYDHLAVQLGEGSAKLWSVLLYCVVEAGAFTRCKRVFEKLSKQGSPSGHDFVNMVRCCASQQDAAGLAEILNNLCSLGHFIDAYTWNRALAACSSSDSVLELADVLASAGICAEGLDGVGYNTLMKYNARAGRISRCFELRTEMLAKGIEASEVTFGILLDACVAARELERAREVFEDLCASGLKLNVVHCTTFIKVLVGASRLDEAEGVLREMVRSPGVKPDVIAYSTLVKGYADNGGVSSAMSILELMLEERVRPDEIIFNSVLSACCSFPMKSAQVLRTFETLIGHGMKPTTTTLSILLKCLAHTEAWTESLQVLKDAPKNFGLEAETRLFAQLAQTCVKARHPWTVLPVFDAMLEATQCRGERLDPVMAGRFLRSCLLGNEMAVATELRDKIRHAGIIIGAQVEKMLNTALAKKQPASVAQRPRPAVAPWRRSVGAS